EPLVEVETEKVNVEIPSPFAGTLTEILVPEGQTVPVGTPLAVIGEAVPAGAPEAPTRSAEAPATAAAPADMNGDGFMDLV
ncbi:MAG: 2-oxoglutarate dehydrogenase, E2 component, dihydrolipoamide succinyltransferase, partial [Chloroflexota bacterium]